MQHFTNLIGARQLYLTYITSSLVVSVRATGFYDLTIFDFWTQTHLTAFNTKAAITAGEKIQFLWRRADIYFSNLSNVPLLTEGTWVKVRADDDSASASALFNTITADAVGGTGSSAWVNRLGTRYRDHAVLAKKFKFGKPHTHILKQGEVRHVHFKRKHEMYSFVSGNLSSRHLSRKWTWIYWLRTIPWVMSVDAANNVAEVGWTAAAGLATTAAKIRLGSMSYLTAQFTGNNETNQTFLIDTALTGITAETGSHTKPWYAQIDQAQANGPTNQVRCIGNSTNPT